MSTSIIVPDVRFHGNRGLHLATPATLARRLLQYQALTIDATVPPALRAYSTAIIAELRDEIRARGWDEGRAA